MGPSGAPRASSVSGTATGAARSLIPQGGRRYLFCIPQIARKWRNWKTRET